MGDHFIPAPTSSVAALPPSVCPRFSLDLPIFRKFCLYSGLFTLRDCVVIGGSAARGGDFNDIDVLALVRNRPRVTARMIPWCGNRVEVFNQAFAGFAACLEQEVLDGRFGKAILLRDGLVLVGSGNPQLSALFRLVQLLDQRGPPVINRAHVAYLFCWPDKHYGLAPGTIEISA